MSTYRTLCVLALLASCASVNAFSFTNASLLAPYKFAPQASILVQLYSVGTSFRVQNLLGVHVDLRFENNSAIFSNISFDEITEYCEDCAVDNPLTIFFADHGDAEPFANCSVPPKPDGQFMTISIRKVGSEYECSDTLNRDVMYYSVEFLTRNHDSARTDFVLPRFNMAFTVAVPDSLKYIVSAPETIFTALVTQANDSSGHNWRNVEGPRTYFELSPFFTSYKSIAADSQGQVVFEVTGVFNTSKYYSCLLINLNKTVDLPSIRTKAVKPATSQKLTVTIFMDKLPILLEDNYFLLSEVYELISENEETNNTIAKSNTADIIVMIPKSVEEKLSGGEIGLIVVGTISLIGLVVGLGIWYRRKVLAQEYRRVGVVSPIKTKYGSSDSQVFATHDPMPAMGI